MPIGPELAIELKRVMTRRGFYSGELDDRWDDEIQRRLELFLGSENYDNRIENGGLFDLEVLADLRRRYGSNREASSRVVLGGAVRCTGRSPAAHEAPGHRVWCIRVARRNPSMK